MSQQVVSQMIERTCEGCGSKTKWDMVNATEEQVLEMAGWFTIIREIFDGDSGRFAKVMVQACRIECVPAAALKLLLPTSEPAASTIDLNSLRANNLN